MKTIQNTPMFLAKLLANQGKCAFNAKIYSVKGCETITITNLCALLRRLTIKQEGPRALDGSPESWHIRWCIGMWLKRYHLKIFIFFSKGCSAELNILINFSRRH